MNKKDAKTIAKATIGPKTWGKYGFHGFTKKAAKRAAAKASRRAGRILAKAD